MVLAGDAYFRGDEIPKDEEKALEMYRRASNLSNTAADIRLYTLYAQGKILPKDSAVALGFLDHAASLHDPAALVLRGEIYEKGLGLSADLHRACADYSSALKLGNRNAMMQLAGLLLDGRGVEHHVPTGTGNPSPRCSQRPEE